MKEKAVIYFSRNGSTRIAAGLIAERIDAELVELKGQKARHGFVLSGFRAVTKKHLPPAGDPWADIRGCSTLVLGAPVWGGNANPVMNGFLDKADFTGKKVYLFTLQADPQKSKSDEVLAHYSQRVKDCRWNRCRNLCPHRGFTGENRRSGRLAGSPGRLGPVELDTVPY